MASGVVKPSGPHQVASSAGSVNMRKTCSHGASSMVSNSSVCPLLGSVIGSFLWKPGREGAEAMGPLTAQRSPGRVRLGDLIGRALAESEENHG